MSKLNEKEVELYIKEKYISSISQKYNIFSEEIIKKIYLISIGSEDKIDILCKQYMEDPLQKQEKTKIDMILKRIVFLKKHKLLFLLLL